jgi:hypothetical protein
MINYHVRSTSAWNYRATNDSSVYTNDFPTKWSQMRMRVMRISTEISNLVI